MDGQRSSDVETFHPFIDRFHTPVKTMQRVVAVTVVLVEIDAY